MASLLYMTFLYKHFAIYHLILSEGYSDNLLLISNFDVVIDDIFMKPKKNIIFIDIYRLIVLKVND